MDQSEIFTNFKSKLCSFYGYDEHLKFRGKGKAVPRARRSKAFLAPQDFLGFAIEDAKALEQERFRANCLTNCKRAIDSQVDRLIRRLGFFPLARQERWSIPKKLEFISEKRIVAPKILRHVNRLRNRLEHEFALPSRQQVEDALGVATLFVSYAEIVRIPSLNWSLSGKETVRYDYEKMVFHFFDKDPEDRPEDEVEPVASVAYGDMQFRGIYEFLMKTVPLMDRKGRLGEDL
jgi:hypothetical protein